jgi:hypothetical protein
MKFMFLLQFKAWVVSTLIFSAFRVLLGSPLLAFPMVWAGVFVGLFVSARRLGYLQYVPILVVAHIVLGLVGVLAVEASQHFLGQALLFDGRTSRFP